jgi:predicted DNA-binding protein
MKFPCDRDPPMPRRNDVTFLFRLPAEQLEKLREASRTTGITQSEMMRRAAALAIANAAREEVKT